ncbi:unnamed protein product [Chrysoparadoxa australica]
MMRVIIFTLAILCPFAQSFYASMSTAAVEPGRTTKASRLLGPLNPKPAADAVKLATDSVNYLEGAQDKAGGAPVFWVHPGVECIVLMDHVSTKFFLAAPSSVFDRQDGLKFGPLYMKQQFMGVQAPALTCNDDEEHMKIREFTKELLRSRAKAVQPMMEKSMDEAYSNLFAKLGDNPSALSLTEAACTIVAEFYFQWINEMPAMEPKDVIAYGLGSAAAFESDTLLSNILVKSLIAVKDTLDPSAQVAIDKGLKVVRASPLYDGYVELAKKMDMPLQDLDHLLLYTTILNGSFGVLLPFETVMGLLPTIPDTLAELRAELDGKTLTGDNIDSFPLLDSFTMEAMRCFIRPSFIFKVAKQDVEIPAGDGKLYKVKKDELVFCFLPTAHRDKAVFKDSPDDFDPKRFLTQPDLKKEVLRNTSWGQTGFKIIKYHTIQVPIFDTGSYSTTWLPSFHHPPSLPSSLSATSAMPGIQLRFCGRSRAYPGERSVWLRWPRCQALQHHVQASYCQPYSAGRLQPGHHTHLHRRHEGHHGAI